MPQQTSTTHEMGYTPRRFAATMRLLFIIAINVVTWAVLGKLLVRLIH